MAERNKVMKITTEIVISDRKIHNSRLVEAFEKGVAALAQSVNSTLLEGSISEVRAYVDWAYVQGRKAVVLSVDNGTLEDREAVLSAIAASVEESVQPTP